MRTTYSWARSYTAALALLVTGPIESAVAALSRHGPPSGHERPQTFIAEGDAAFERGEHGVAVEKYEAAYDGLDERERISFKGSILVRKAMQAYGLLMAREPSRELLERQLALLEKFLAEVDARPDGRHRVGETVVGELEAKRDAMERELSALAPEPAPASEPVPAAEQASKPEPVSGSEPEPEAQGGIEPLDGEPHETPPPRSKIGMGLAAAGGAIFATGAGLLVGWWTVRDQAIDYANNEPGYEKGTAERTRYLGREEDHARRYLMAGSIVMSVGFVTTATGVGLIARQLRVRGKSTRLSLAPSFDGRVMGLVASGRF